MNKKVTFNLNNNKIYNTYSKNEYDRNQIDSTLYLYNYCKISQQQWTNILRDLNFYKLNQMPVHIDSIHNTKLI